MLTKMVYPTGGYMMIEYEQNKYGKYMNDDRCSSTHVNDDQLAGGLRVSKISCYDNGELVLSKRYKYELADGKSSGVLYSLPRYKYKWTSPVPFDSIMWTYRAGSVIPLSNSFGSHIGYSRVVELNVDNSYTASTFLDMELGHDNSWYYSFNVGYTPYDRYSERGYLCGKLLTEAKYDPKGRKIMFSKFEYTSDREYNILHRTLAICINSRYELDHTDKLGIPYFYNCTIYEMYYPKIYLQRKEVNMLVGGKWMKEVTTYNYKEKVIGYTSQGKTYKANVKQIGCETRERGGDVVKFVYSYPYDDVGTNYRLTSDFHLPITSTRKYHNGEFLEGSMTSYGVVSGGNLLPKYEIAIKCNEDILDTIVRYEGYYMDSRYYMDKKIGERMSGQLAEAYDAKGIRHRYFWNNHDKLVAIVDNGTSSLSLNPGALKADDVFKGSSGVFGTEPLNVTTCSYNTRGLVSSVSKANKQLLSYRYDAFGRLAEINDKEGRRLEKYDYQYKTSGSEVIGIYDDANEELTTLRDNDISYIFEDKEDYKGTINSMTYSNAKKEITVSYKIPLNATNGKLHVYAKYPKYSGIVINKSLPVGKGSQSISVDISSILNEVDQSYRNTKGLKEVFKDVQIELYVGGELKDTKQQNVDLAGDVH